MATEPRTLNTLDAMWLIFQALANNKTHAINGEKTFPGVRRRRACGHLPRRAPDPPEIVVAKTGRPHSRLHADGFAQKSSHDECLKIYSDCTDPWTDTSSNC